MARRPALLPALACCLLAPAAALVAPEEYALDPVHTRIVFAIDHAGFSRALGTLSGITGTLRFDPADWSTAQVEARIPLERLDMGDADWNRRMLERPFFDAARHPVARFVSTAVEPLGEDRARVTGRLELRGTSRQVVLEVELNALKRHPMTYRRTAGFSATGALLRRDFGMLAWPSVVGDRVELRIEAEAHRGRGDAPATEEGPAR